jgi:phosphoglycerate dehydrogenase-like enzyme
VRELYDVTIGIIGASRTGRHVLRLLKEFDARVVVCDPTIDGAEAASLGARLVTMDELMRVSDVVSLHAPALPKLHHMLGRQEFAAMKDDAIFLNTARGMLVDESALIAELQTGRISAILDVTSPEPPAKDSPLRSLPNVTLLPHIAGAISTGCLRQGRSTVDQLLEFAAGERMQGEISRERFDIMA